MLWAVGRECGPNLPQRKVKHLWYFFVGYHHQCHWMNWPTNLNQLLSRVIFNEQSQHNSDWAITFCSLNGIFLLTSFYGSLKRLWMSIKTHTLKIGLQHCKRGNMSQSTSTEVLVKKLGWVETSWNLSEMTFWRMSYNTIKLGDGDCVKIEDTVNPHMIVNYEQ